MIEYSVLVIDDDIWMRRILSKTLQSYGFKQTFLASNGFEGVAIAVENRPILIIMDILMPELSGIQALKILKHIKLTTDIPILMVSAQSDTENIGLSVKSGASGFISKPFTRATVFEKLINIFGKEKLNLIIKGEYVDLGMDYSDSSSIPDSFREDSPLQGVSDMISPSTRTQTATKPTGSQEKLLQTYQQDEQRNLESIKKLLMKTRNK